MGILEEFKKKVQGDPYAKVRTLVNEVDRIITSSWKKIEGEQTNRTDRDNEEEFGYEFLYQAERDKVRVELNYNHPYVEIVLRSSKKMVEHKIMISEFVEKKALKPKLKNQKEMEKVVKRLLSKIEEN